MAIPEDAYASPIVYINGVSGDKLIDKTELISLIRALDTLAKDDVATVGIGDVLGLIVAGDTSKIDGGDGALLNSKIIWNFISESIVDNSVAITVPDVVKTTVVTPLDRITKAEIVKMLLSMKTMGMNDTNDLSGVGISSLTTLDDTQLDTVLNSDIMYYTMSEKVRTNGTLSIPEDAYASPVVYINGVDGDKLIDKAELKHFIVSLKTMGGDDATDVTLATIIGKVVYTYSGADIIAADTTSIATILDSIIVYDFISTSIVNSSSSSLVVPHVAHVDADIAKRLTKTEIEHMLAAMGILGFTDPNNIVIQNATITGLTNIEFGLVLQSDIMWYSISKYFIDNHAAEIALAGITIHNDGNDDYIDKVDLMTLKAMI